MNCNNILVSSQTEQDLEENIAKLEDHIKQIEDRNSELQQQLAINLQEYVIISFSFKSNHV